MGRCKYFIDNNLNSVTGWKNERCDIIGKKRKSYKKVLLEKEEEDNE